MESLFWVHYASYWSRSLSQKKKGSMTTKADYMVSQLYTDIFFSALTLSNIIHDIFSFMS